MTELSDQNRALDLEACPFCGCHGLSFAWPREFRNRMVAIVECHTDNCYAMLTADTPDQAVTAWNRRADAARQEGAPAGEVRWKQLGAALVAHAGGNYSWPTIGGQHAHDPEYMSLHGNDWHLPTIFAALTLSAQPPRQEGSAPAIGGEVVSREEIVEALEPFAQQFDVSAWDPVNDHLRAYGSLSRSDFRRVAAVLSKLGLSQAEGGGA